MFLIAASFHRTIVCRPKTVDFTSHEQALQFSPDGKYASSVTCAACQTVTGKGSRPIVGHLLRERLLGDECHDIVDDKACHNIVDSHQVSGVIYKQIQLPEFYRDRVLVSAL